MTPTDPRPVLTALTVQLAELDARITTMEHSR